jgi:chromosome segregation protein
VRGAEAEWLACCAPAPARRWPRAAALDAAQAATKRAEAEAEAAAVRAFEAEKAIPAPREAEAAARTALERHRVETEGLEAEERRAADALDAAAGRLARMEDDLGHAEKLAADAARPSDAWKPRTAP